jgi:urease accessory protein
MRSKSAFPAVVLALIGGPAYAHTGGHAIVSLESGFLHPLGGLDHVLAMFAVGLLAAQVGGRARWLVPGAFIAMMIAGALVGLTGTEVPGVEIGILLSVIAIALPVAFVVGMPAAGTMVYVGFFALFHGFAHGAELPVDGEAAPYIAGFALATALIHSAGVLVGVACGKVAFGRDAYALRIAGGLVILAGLGAGLT